jgi:hypothetical protein
MLLSPADKSFLCLLTRDVCRACSIPPNAGSGPEMWAVNHRDVPLIAPGGHYPAFWTRDMTMSLAAGFFAPSEVLPHLRLLAAGQNGPEPFKHPLGWEVPAWSIPDHMQNGSRPVYFPGIGADAYPDHAPTWNGDLPPQDDHYYITSCAHWYWRNTGCSNFLTEVIRGVPLIERLIRAFDAPETDAATGLCTTTDERRAIGFGFHDTVHLSGKMLFVSLLRWQAAGELAELCSAAGRVSDVEKYLQVRQQVQTSLNTAFDDSDRIGGWLLAATGTGRQPDVWGTCLALHLGVLSPERAADAAQTIVRATRKGEVAHEGAVRHVPLGHDFAPGQCWEKTEWPHAKYGHYQHGGYWHTATGWLVSALATQDISLARQIAKDYVDHLRLRDYRNSKHGKDAPWESIGPGKEYDTNSVYLTSVTIPWSILRDR